ncbi:hypothetical protein [Methylobacterium radiotolerans]|uniref:Uncharacterized protein n=1 Tax=Methylobacterium radiotolerans (strain ATCC 27329 / DSM 1819 / JCM 2831 / NBRC 15690 / NCIMB 10815 / 0-1) TaxID=426355 RepID=B1M2P3_METRJ|nr:hypothetical protein [Methylobacterium radiotolerans]ACB27691.1 hypothetical protein Mrad2831_5746 [Methylobacterium radiotolerans JCM 2831]GEM95866.1 hypothetical protein MRA01_04060 [Methylobacterium radiotolerans]
MTILLHLIWISLKGLVIFVAIFGAGAGATVLMFGTKAPNGDALAGLAGGGVLLFVLVFGGAYVFLGGRA